LIVISVWLDSASLPSGGQLLPLLKSRGAWLLRCILGFSALFLTFAYLKNRTGLARISDELVGLPLRRGFLAFHLAALGMFAALSSLLFGGSLPAHYDDFVAVGWLLAGLAAIAVAAFAFLPPAFWAQIIASGGNLWAFAIVAALAASYVGNMSRSLWDSAAYLTFHLSRTFLSLFVSDVVANPARLRLGTPQFRVMIDDACSGLEGVGLIVAFGVVWLWIFRKESRFPHALALIPAGVVLVFLLNSLRIAVLILIGDAGARQIALGGFHSQAGWIGFSAVALGLVVAARRIPWLSVASPVSEPRSSTNPTAVYFLPFLAIVAAGMFSRSGSGRFEWLHPMRLFAAAVIFWVFRREYARLDWKVGFTGPAIGTLVFALWIALDWFSGTIIHRLMPAALDEAGTVIQVSWIALRALTAVVAMPIAEELAFRGYVMRRLMSADFESVSPRTFSWFALAASSLAFGLLHGDFWIAGTLAGLIYGAVVVRTGRIAEAIVAHATTNALLVAYILSFDKWHLW
jgi:exosortase E/protease (VPEID-CTERM system)